MTESRTPALPPMPEPKGNEELSAFPGFGNRDYTAEQMREYARAALRTVAAPADADYVRVPLEPTEEMLDVGQHVNSEWLNDNAPIGARRYRDPARAVYQNMVAAVLSTQQGADK